MLPDTSLQIRMSGPAFAMAFGRIVICMVSVVLQLSKFRKAATTRVLLMFELVVLEKLKVGLGILEENAPPISL